VRVQRAAALLFLLRDMLLLLFIERDAYLLIAILLRY